LTLAEPTDTGLLLSTTMLTTTGDLRTTTRRTYRFDPFVCSPGV